MFIFYRRTWENRILDTLNRRPNKKCDYVLLRSEQVPIFVDHLSPLVSNGTLA